MKRICGAALILYASLCSTVPAAAQPPGEVPVRRGASRPEVTEFGASASPATSSVTAAQAPAAPTSSSGSTSVRLPLRAIHASGNWGTNEQVFPAWEADRTRPLVPPDYIEWLESLHVNWIGLSVALTYDDSMDSTVERNAEYSPSDGASFSDDAIRQFVREVREHGIDVYLTLAFEAFAAETAVRPVERWQLGDPGGEDGGPCCDSGILPEFWPWRPDHPDHRRFVAEFWETYTEHAVHVARIAEEEGVRLYSLGTETDRLFRTRPWDYFTNDFREELASMVSQVRAVYSGLLTYDMHYQILRNPGFYGPADDLWRDLALDVVGISAWFPLADSPPSTVRSVESLQATYENIFRDYLVPLSEETPGRPVVLLEYGAKDRVEAGGTPNLPGFPPFVFTDGNGNGIDDGRETQANIYRAMFNVMDSHLGVVNGAFLWDNWLTSAELWAGYWADHRAYHVRDKPAEEIVRSAYALWRDRSNRPPERVGTLASLIIGVDDAAVSLDIAPAFRDPDGDPLSYRTTSSAPAVAATAVSGSMVTVAPVAAGTAAVSVTATDPRGLSATQSFGVTVTAAATGSFTEDPLVPGVTPIRAAHFTELRTHIDALRVTAGLPAFSWTDPVLRAGVTPVTLVHLRELREALSAAYVAAGRLAPSWTDPAPTAGSTPISAAHVMELRAAVIALE